MEADVSETDHRMYVWRVDGRAVLRTELSTPLRDVGTGLIAHIARKQLLLKDGAKDLAALVACTYTQESWREHLSTVAQDSARRLL